MSSLSGSQAAGRRMKYPYSMAGKLLGFPFKFHMKTRGFRFVTYSFIITMPVWWKLYFVCTYTEMRLYTVYTLHILASII